MKRLKKFLFLAGAAFLALVLFSLFLPIPRKKLDPGPVISLRLLDRNGVVLREVLSDEGGRCRWVGLADIPPHLVQATIAAEDKSFYFHGGVNPLSVVRALWQNMKRGRVVSGASTITQQLVRNIYPARRNLLSKLREAWLAFRLERTISKEEILTQYLNRISYANQAFGIEAASRLYFAKPASHLSLAEAAFLAAIPRSPSLLNPYCSFALAEAKQKEILRKMARLHFISSVDLERARMEEIRLLQAGDRFRAPHFCDFVLSQIAGEMKRSLAVVRTTLDFGLQEKVERLASRYTASLAERGITNCALIVLDNMTGELLSLVGSRDFFDSAHDGQVNGALALRQPGSTLKPFTYALALENGLTAATVVEDVPAQFATLSGSYMPRNYDRKYHGPMRLREALACSYNVPAVAVLESIGPDLLYRRLKSLGFDSLKKSPGYYGIGLTLGNGEVTLLELARAYSVLARQGVDLPLKTVLDLSPDGGEDIQADGRTAQRTLFSPQVSFIITHILTDRDARIPSFGYNTPLSFPFAVAAKTGTSKDFRDNWTVGYSPKFTVGVWVGNFDGSPMHHVSGITGCGPLFRDVMLLLHRDEGWTEFAEPKGIVRATVCSLSGNLPGESCPGTVEEVFIRGTEPQEVCAKHGLQATAGQTSAGRKQDPTSQGMWISFPRNGDIFQIDPVLRDEYQRIKLKVSLAPGSPARKVEWLVNGRKVGEAAHPYSIFWNLLPGSYTIKARTTSGRLTVESQPVRITVLS